MRSARSLSAIAVPVFDQDRGGALLNSADIALAPAISWRFVRRSAAEVAHLSTAIVGRVRSHLKCRLGRLSSQPPGGRIYVFDESLLQAPLLITTIATTNS